MRIQHFFMCGVVCVLIFSFTTSSFARSKKRRGSTSRSRSVEITSIESIKLEPDKTGLIWYSFKAKARNLRKRAIKISLCFQAVDRSGFELEDICFFDKRIQKNGTARLTDRKLIQAADYKNIWEWKVESLHVQ